MDFKRLKGVRLKNKRVLTRVDFNVPRNKDGDITDDTRLDVAIPTIKHLQKAGAITILLTHFGRPKGKVDARLSTRFLVPALVEKLGSEVFFSAEINPGVISALPAGAVILLENTRFDPREAKCEDSLSEAYAALGDIFVADAFSVAHRAHASSTGIAKYLPAYVGLAMERELDHLSQALDNPKSPVMGVVGGAKVSTKIDLLNNLVKKLDMLAIGGGMANTFLAAQGRNVGASLCEHELTDMAKTILASAKKAGCEIILPVDVVLSKDFKAGAKNRTAGLDDVKKSEMILDAGPETVNMLADKIDKAKTLIWNGPLGAFEIPPFDTATVAAAKYVAKRAKTKGLIAVAGGGDTVAALKHAQANEDFTYISAAGGAFLEWMEGKSLPGVEILTQKA